MKMDKLIDIIEKVDTIPEAICFLGICILIGFVIYTIFK